MSIELLITACPRPETTNSDYIVKPYQGLREQIEARLRAVRQDTLEAAADAYLALDPNEIFPNAVDAVLDFICSWSTDPETTTLYTGAEVPLIVTGGLSGGDSPTRCFGVVSFIDSVDLFEEPFDAEADAWFVTVEEKVWRTYRVKAESEEAARLLALEVDDDREIYETLVTVKDGTVLLDDEGTYPDPEIMVSIVF